MVSSIEVQFLASNACDRMLVTKGVLQARLTRAKFPTTEAQELNHTGYVKYRMLDTYFKFSVYKQSSNNYDNDETRY
jgi:hypothetical protein